MLESVMQTYVHIAYNTLISVHYTCIMILKRIKLHIVTYFGCRQFAWLAFANSARNKLVKYVMAIIYRHQSPNQIHDICNFYIYNDYMVFLPKLQTCLCRKNFRLGEGGLRALEGQIT